MTEKEKNDFFYVCALIEFTARKTRNKRGVIVRAMGEEGVKKELYDAEVNHCLSFEQVSDEITDLYYQNPSYLEWSYREGRLLE